MQVRLINLSYHLSITCIKWLENTSSLYSQIFFESIFISNHWLYACRMSAICSLWAPFCHWLIAFQLLMEFKFLFFAICLQWFTHFLHQWIYSCIWYHFYIFFLHLVNRCLIGKSKLKYWYFAFIHDFNKLLFASSVIITKNFAIFCKNILLYFLY